VSRFGIKQLAPQNIILMDFTYKGYLRDMVLNGLSEIIDPDQDFRCVCNLESVPEV